MTNNHEETASAAGGWQSRWQGALMDTYGTPRLNLVKGKGSHVWDSEDKEFLDLLSGIAVNALGHAHPAVIDAVTKQISTLGHTSNIFAHPQVIELATKLSALVGAEGAKVFFCNSGAEANEAAFKIARATGRPKILAAERGFHGRTMGSLAMTGQPDKREPFEPMPPGVEFYPYGDLDAVRDIADDKTAAIILESIQGETGVIPAPAGFLKGLRDLCDERGILLIVDEVQAGMGRTGEWFGFQAASIIPDVITMAKGLGGGLPIGACVATPRAQVLSKGMHGTTFGGNPVACAAANAVIDTIETESILDNVNEVSAIFRDGLSKHPLVTEIRGRGLMLGVVLSVPCTLNPIDYGLLLNKPAPDVLRIVPPLNISKSDAEDGVRKITAMLDDLAAQSPRENNEN